MKRMADRTSDKIVARPIANDPPFASSDKVEIASKPRKLRTASDKRAEDDARGNHRRIVKRLNGEMRAVDAVRQRDQPDAHQHGQDNKLQHQHDDVHAGRRLDAEIVDDRAEAR
jgi:hypothetical protein